METQILGARCVLGTGMELMNVGLEYFRICYLKPTSEEWGFEGAYEKSQTLGKEIEKVAREESTFFIDLVKEGISPNEEEAVHLSKEMHAKIAQIFQEKIQSIL